MSQFSVTLNAKIWDTENMSRGYFEAKFYELQIIYVILRSLMRITEQEIDLERREFIKDLLGITALGAIIFGGGYDGLRRAGKFAKIESEISNATKEELAKQNITPPTQEELKQLTEIDRDFDKDNVVYNRTSEEIKQAQNILTRKKATDAEERKQRDERSGETPSKVVIYGEGVAASGAFAVMAKKLGLL